MKMIREEMIQVFKKALEDCERDSRRQDGTIAELRRQLREMPRQLMSAHQSMKEENARLREAFTAAERRLVDQASEIGDLRDRLSRAADSKEAMGRTLGIFEKRALAAEARMGQLVGELDELRAGLDKKLREALESKEPKPSEAKP